MDFTSRRHGLAFVAGLLGLSQVAVAQTGPDLLLGPFGEGQDAVVRGDAYFLNRGTADDGEGVKLDIYNSQGRFKLDFFDVGETIRRAQPRAGYKVTYMHLGPTDAPLPDQFSDTSVGIGLGIAKGEKWVAGLSFGVGHASASPFSDGNGYYIQTDLAIGYTFNDRERLGIVLNFNGNRTFMPDVPLPGFAYTRKVGGQVVVTAGFPFSDIEYKPDDRWTFKLRYLFPDGGEADIAYTIVEGVQVYAGLSQQNEAFHWDALSDGTDRVLFRQSRVELGFRGVIERVSKDLSFVVAGGYAFNTEFETGWDSRDTEHLTDLSDEPYLRVGFEVKF